MQTDLFDSPALKPEGFSYWPDLISVAEENALLEWISSLELKPFEFQGFLGQRRVASFGSRYDYSSKSVEVAPPLPGPVLPLRNRVAGVTRNASSDFSQAMVTEYSPGAPIGWHRDKAHYGIVVGVSLLSKTGLRFRRATGGGWARHSIMVDPRSAYLISGSAREDWEHSIPPHERLRYSITFRTLA